MSKRRTCLSDEPERIIGGQKLIEAILDSKGKDDYECYQAEMLRVTHPLA